MPVRLAISFPSAEAQGRDFTHRVRNFAEDLERALVSAAFGVVENMDTATTAVVARIASPRHFGEAVLLARSEARRHHLEEGARFERER